MAELKSLKISSEVHKELKIHLAITGQKTSTFVETALRDRIALENNSSFNTIKNGNEKKEKTTKTRSEVSGGKAKA